MFLIFLQILEKHSNRVNLWRNENVNVSDHHHHHLAAGWEELEGPIQEIMKLVSVGSTENTWDPGLR